MKRNARLTFLLLIPVISFSLIGCDVLQHHLHGTRDGLYIDPHMTHAAAVTIRRDSTFRAPLPGPVHAQPLYVTGGPGGRAAFMVATEQNMVLALDAANGS